jgi:uncharacterized protein
VSDIENDVVEEDFDDDEAAVSEDVLEYVVRALVDDPDAVEVEVEDGRRGLSMRVSVAPGDMGRVIGRRGRNANAIRTLVRAAAVKDGVEVDVDFVD